MSVYVTASLWKHSPHSGSDLLILLAMGDQARDEGLCWLSIESLASRTRLDRRSVQRRLRVLEASEALVRVSEAHGHDTRMWWIDTPATAQHDPRTPQGEAAVRRILDTRRRSFTAAAQLPQADETPSRKDNGRARLCPVCSSRHPLGEVCAGAAPAKIGLLRDAVRRTTEGEQ